jgi:hypothetical protein
MLRWSNFTAGGSRDETSLRGFPEESHIAPLSRDAGSVKLFMHCAKFLPAVTGSYGTVERSEMPHM